MSKIEEIIQHYCPYGVEWVPFFDVCELIRGITYNKEQEAKTQTSDAHKVLRANNITLHLNTLNFNDVKLVSKDVVVKPDQHLFKGDILMCAGSGSKEHVGKVAFISEDLDYTFGGFMAVIRSKGAIKPRFLFHILTSGYFSNHLDVQINSSTINNINKQVMQSFELPVPPFPVQEEIVRVLDTLTELQAELQTELQAELQKRIQQYSYYTDKLFSFERDNNVKWEQLGSVATVTKLAGFEFTNYVKYSDTGTIIALRGLNVKNGHIDLSDVKYIDGSDFSKLNRSKLKVSDLLYTYVGTVGQVAIVDKNDAYYLAPNVAMIRVQSTGLNPKFLMYYLLSGFFWDNQVLKLLQNSSMKNIPMEKIRKYDIPIPSLLEQNRIVEILDRFDTHTTDLTSTLQEEIEERRQYFEYYRDKLLTFKRKEA